MSKTIYLYDLCPINVKVVVQKMVLRLMIILTISVYSCHDPANEREQSVLVANKVSWLNNEATSVELGPLQKERIKQFNKAMTQEISILLIPAEQLTPAQAKAQTLILSVPDFIKFSRHFETGEKLRCEIMSIGALTSKEYKKYNLNAICDSCMYIDLYNYFYNQTMRAIIDIEKPSIILIDQTGAGQPYLRSFHQDLAEEIVLSHPVLRKDLGLENQFFPTNWKKTFQISKAERSMHLSVVLNIWKDNRIFRALVDLTDLKLVGTQWVDSEDIIGIDPLTERSLENDFVMQNFCRQEKKLTRGPWSFQWKLTGSDGIELLSATYKGKPIITTAKLMDWHVSYESGEKIGYTDAMGCPMYSTAAVVAFQGPRIEPILRSGQEIGFRFIQDFKSPVWPYACNYYYQNIFEFYEDGRFRIAGANLGLGCGGNAWYKPVLRIELFDGKKETQIEKWEAEQWRNIDMETWTLQDASTTYNETGYQFRFKQGDMGYYLLPNKGQFEDNSRGDNAYTYFSKWHANEGVEDTPTMGNCCTNDEKLGPELFISPAEKLTGHPVVIWYVPQMRNDNRPGHEYCWAATEVIEGLPHYRTWPGIVGPMFIPMK
jgi:hypothetical protein